MPSIAYKEFNIKTFNLRELLKRIFELFVQGVGDHNIDLYTKSKNN